MKHLNENESKEALKWIDLAAEVANQSPCLRAHCGAVIVKDVKVIGKGFNSPPQNNPEFRTCLNEYDIPAGFRHDRTCCIHAEQRAITDAIRQGHDTKGAKIYFVRTDESGNKLNASRLVCTICSRAVLDAGIVEFILYWEDGIRSYNTKEFNEGSYAYMTPSVS